MNLNFCPKWKTLRVNEACNNCIFFYDCYYDIWLVQGQFYDMLNLSFLGNELYAMIVEALLRVLNMKEKIMNVDLYKFLDNLTIVAPMNIILPYSDKSFSNYYNELLFVFNSFLEGQVSIDSVNQITTILDKMLISTDFILYPKWIRDIIGVKYDNIIELQQDGVY